MVPGSNPSDGKIFFFSFFNEFLLNQMLQTRASSTGFEPKIPVPISVPELPVPISVPEPGNMQALWN